MISDVVNGTLVGEKPLDFSQSKGKLLQPIVLKSKRKQIEVNFPEGVVVKSNGKDFTGIMMVPEYGTGTT